VYVAQEMILLDAHLEMVPFACLVMRRGLVEEHFPAIDVRAFEARQTELARRGVEAVVLLIAVGMENQPCRARFAIQLDADGHFIGNLGQRQFRNAERAAAEALAWLVHEQTPRALLPSRAE